MSNIKVTRKDYLDAVEKYKTLSDKILGEKLNTTRQAVFRFRKYYEPETYEEAKRILENVEEITQVEVSTMDRETFRQIPIMKEYADILDTQEISPRQKEGYLNAVYNVCKALNQRPERLDVDYVANKIKEWKTAKKEGIKYPRGCAYNTIRIGLRSFFTILLGVTAKQLTLKGIGAEHSDGFGKLAKEKIPKEKRHAIIRDMEEAVRKVVESNTSWKEKYTDDLIPSIVCEMKSICYFMFYTASRITATLETTLNDKENKYENEIWIIHIVDKGKFKTGRQDWNKRLMGDALNKMKSYIHDRFGTEEIDMQTALPKMDKPIFPILSNNYRFVCAIMGEVQKMNGMNFAMQNHIWRHTFAQEWLEVMKGNYEVGAEVGGWKDIGTMKRCYGAVPERIVLDGLREAMGLQKPQEKKELRF